MYIDAMIEKLLDMDMVKEDNSVKFSEDAIQLIHEIADKCKDIPIVSIAPEMAAEYEQDLTAEQVYVDMLCKIVAAPTRLHMVMSARILIPIISSKLKERGA